VEATVYYGSSRIQQKQTQAIPLVKDIKSSVNETKTYDIAVLNDKLMFDVSQIEQENDLRDGAREVFAIIVVKYLSISNFFASNFGLVIKNGFLKPLKYSLFR
jgi:hypothetical protein